MKKTITAQIRTTALKILADNPAGVPWSQLNKNIEEVHPDFHPKTINGIVWKLTEKFPDTVHKPQKGLFQLKKFS